LVTIVGQSGNGKSTLLNLVDGLDVPGPRKIYHSLVESISKEIILVSEGFFCNDRESSLIHESHGQIIPELSPN
jgi:predicted ABC-type transport system involved in lysophospholipase L1 biosynthesis ATPase subunit